jgi:signal transduction histidine kinase
MDPIHDSDALQRKLRRLDFLDRLGQTTRPLTDPTELMAVSARLLGEELGATRCAYADVEADSNRFTIRADWSRPGVPSSAGAYVLDLFGASIAAGLREGRQMVVRDVDRELADDDGGAMFRAIGIRAVVCAALVKQGRLVALMAVHQDRPRDWSADDLALIEEVVDRCWAHIERVRAVALLEEQDRNKDVFLATLAHELRNPLAPMRYAAAMLALPEPAHHARAREVIGRQVGLMARLIDDLLDLSRINRGLIVLQRETLDMAVLLERAVEIARAGLEAAGHAFAWQVPPGPAPVHGDPARIVQVLANLLNNATKYTPDGGRVAVSAWTEADQVFVEVADTGLGIAPADQERVFQMFAQLPHTAGHAKGGLGIGLALARHLVALHGGSLTVASEGLGQGSRFRVALPLAQDQPVAPPALDAEAPAPAAARARVLVVEDNDDSRETLQALLQALGHEVRAAPDGRSALALAPSWAPQLVLLDLGLPDIGGIAVAQQLRAGLLPAGSRIVALSGWGTAADRARTRAAGFDDHLVKPVDLPRLRQVVEGQAAPA